MMLSDAQRAHLRTTGTLIGRILMGLLFLVSGLMILTGESGIVGFGGMIEQLGLPLAGLLAWIVVLVKILGGAGLILGYKVGKCAFALFVFVLLTIVFAHNFFVEPEQLGMALKNLAIMGGLLYVMAYGAGEGWKLEQKSGTPSV